MSDMDTLFLTCQTGQLCDAFIYFYILRVQFFKINNRVFAIVISNSRIIFSSFLFDCECQSNCLPLKARLRNEIMRRMGHYTLLTHSPRM